MSFMNGPFNVVMDLANEVTFKQIMSNELDKSNSAQFCNSRGQQAKKNNFWNLLLLALVYF